MMQKTGKKFFLYIVVIALLVSSYFPIAFVYSEWSRERILDSYRAPANFILDFRKLGIRSAAELMAPTETLICAVDAYGNPEAIADLNASQRRSLSKDELPSEDMTWYLIFYSQKQAQRVILMEQLGDNGIRLIGSGCYDQSAKYIVSRAEQKSGTQELEVRFVKEELK